MLAQGVGEVVGEIISARLQVDLSRLTPPARFDELAADPLERVELVLALEEVFDITMPDEATALLRTVQDAIDCVRGRLAV